MTILRRLRHDSPRSRSRARSRRRFVTERVSRATRGALRAAHARPPHHLRHRRPRLSADHRRGRPAHRPAGVHDRRPRRRRRARVARARALRGPQLRLRVPARGASRSTSRPRTSRSRGPASTSRRRAACSSPAARCPAERARPLGGLRRAVARRRAAPLRRRARRRRGRCGDTGSTGSSCRASARRRPGSSTGSPSRGVGDLAGVAAILRGDAPPALPPARVPRRAGAPTSRTCATSAGTLRPSAR